VNIVHIVGARPNFMKVAPVLNALKQRKNVAQTLVHTGQHYDVNMSDVFFQQLDIPAPDVNLAVGSGSHAKQTAEIMMRLEPAVLERQPDIVLVYGDVNSTVATVLVCAKLGVQVGHVEAGLRSFDRTMPEEISRRRESSARRNSGGEDLPCRQCHDRFARAPFTGRAEGLHGNDNHPDRDRNEVRWYA
jgi:UDP-N-acetylglucosamine 2-epimerase (non-hydrolysing)